MKNPKLQFRRTVACPTSGIRRCMAGYAFFACGEITCGYQGLTFQGERIELPDEETASLEHEAVHWILYELGEPRYADHAHPAFAACGWRQP